MVNLRANISGGEHYIDNREMALQTVKGPLRCPKISRTLVY